MTPRLLRLLIGCVIGFVCTITSANGADVDYTKQIKPLLRERCYSCHGGLRQRGGLRLDTVQAILKGGDSGAVAVAGDVSASLIIERVATTELATRMPPENEGEPLSAVQVQLLKDWIAGGAVAPEDEVPETDPRAHWAFRPIVRPPVPTVRNQAWVRNPIDAFVAQKHEERGLTPLPESDSLILLRRINHDLIGVPPTLDEVADLSVQPTTSWYDQHVERLLTDPRHGERWARHWMDVWRYSDWWGLGDQLRNSQAHIWHWRDWIIESLNADTPYDEMVRLMLAGDEIAPTDLNALRATGFLARNYFLFNRNQWMEETVEHVSKGFLGLTMNCAKCHDHKYDPFSHEDYYRMRAVFEPYHVRVDVLPGELNLARNGLPRVFDGLLDVPTYRFIRGQESQPDKSKVIQPGIPRVFEAYPFEVTAVDLPVEAWQPEQREWVMATHRKVAAERSLVAEQKLRPAQEKLEKAIRHETEVKERSKTESPTTKAGSDSKMDPLVLEKFESLNLKHWTLAGGDWKHETGRIEQRRDGAQRAALRWHGKIPRDFDAKIRFTIRGGSQWRSVGMAYDVTQADSAAEPGPTDSEQTVYVSAFEGGPKVQAAFHRGGQWQYPNEAMAARPVKLNQEYILQVQVRDTLINASLNGDVVIVWRSPLARKDGAWQVMTFDALAEIHEITVAPLEPSTRLHEPGNPAIDPSTPAGAAHLVSIARLELQIAEFEKQVGIADQHALEERIAAMQAEWRAQASFLKTADRVAVSPTDKVPVVGLDGERVEAKASDETPARKAARAEVELLIAKERLSVATAELRHLTASIDKRDAIAKELATTQESFKKAEQKRDDPGTQFTKLSGAAWSATRFLNSGADDPLVKFPATSTGRRSALANWITDRRNPLAARVVVNHLWMRHMGTPLVPTVFDLGRKGAPPTHPELLDWLAVELIESGWSMRHLHRLIVGSATYRLSTESSDADHNRSIDKENTLLWCRSSTRMESQVVRDSILALAGGLDWTRGGPPVSSAQQSDSRRRSLYFFHSNNERNLFLTMFDEALVKECYRREQSIVPQQALALSHSKLVLDSAPQIAARLSDHLSERRQTADDPAFVSFAFRALLGVEPSPAESSACLRVLQNWRQLPEAGSGVDADHFARGNLIWVLLNHSDFVTVH